MLALAVSVCLGALHQLASANDLGNPSESDFQCPPSTAAFNDNNAMRVPVETGYFLPILSSKGAQTRTHLALVVLHGSTRNVEEYYTSMVGVSNEVECGGLGTAVVAPAIPSVVPGTECTGADWGKGGSSSDKALTWSGTREWALGQNDDRVDGGVSTFKALDKVVEWAVNTWKRTLRAIVVTGFSTGAQLALRWSIFSAEGENSMTASVHPSSGKAYPLRMVVSSPSTVTYLNNMRPSLNCTEDESTASDHSCDSFEMPMTGSRRRGTFVQKTCDGQFDDYQYGLSGLSGAADGTAAADVASYLGDDFMASADVAEALRQRFKSKDIRFLAGAEDVRACGEGSCSDSCEARTTGMNRLQRLLNYMGHLEEVLGVTPDFGVFPGGHEHILALRSNKFVEWGFPGLIDEETGECDIESQVDKAASLAALWLPVALMACFGVILPLTCQLQGI